jgi:antitoxin ParD1/3/4
MATKVQKLSIALPKEMVKDIKSAVASGRYATTSEVIREAVRDWRDKPRELPERVRVPKTREEFRKRLRDAIASLDRGEGIPAEQVYAAMRARIRAVAAGKKKPA